MHNFTPFHTRYNDISPLENHHLSAALTLLREDQYAFMPNASKKVWRQPDNRFIMEESFGFFSSRIFCRLLGDVSTGVAV